MESDSTNEIIYRIIEDHIQYSCSVESLKIWRCIYNKGKDISPSEEENMKLRKNVIDSIRNLKTYEAFEMLKKYTADDKESEMDSELFNKLTKLVFIDYMENKKIVEAIEFAKMYLEKRRDFTELHILIGYDDINDNVIKELCKDIDRNKILDDLNAFLFFKLTGRRCSLLHSSVMYYNTLLKIQK